MKYANTKVGDYFNINILRAQRRAQVNFDPISGPMLICAFNMTQTIETEQKKKPTTKPIPKKSNHFLCSVPLGRTSNTQNQSSRERKRKKGHGNKNKN